MVLKCCPLCNASDLRTNPRNRHHVGLEFCIGLKKIKVLLKVFLKVFLQRGLGGLQGFFKSPLPVSVPVAPPSGERTYLYRLARWRSSECHSLYIWMHCSVFFHVIIVIKSDSLQNCNNICLDGHLVPYKHLVQYNGLSSHCCLIYLLFIDRYLSTKMPKHSSILIRMG